MRCRALAAGLSCVLLVVCTSIPVVGQSAAPDGNWPKFRGPDSGVVSDDSALPDSWSRTENVAWKIDLPGTAWSSPIVWGDDVFVTTIISDEQDPDLAPRPVENRHHLELEAPLSTPYRWVLYAVDFHTGAIRWERELRQDIVESPKHRKNSYASETPVTDGERVYVYHADAGLFAVDFGGTLVWSRDVELFRPPPEVLKMDDTPSSGQAASPALHGGRIFVVDDHDDSWWFFAAFDTATGEELWRETGLKEGAAIGTLGFSTPFVWENELRTEIIFVANGRVRSYDPTGQLLWELKGLTFCTAPTPIASHGLLYVQSGLPGAFRPIYAIRPGGSGDISLAADATSSEYVAWSQQRAGAYVPSALVYGDCLYTLHSQGFLTCHDPDTGREVFGRTRIGGVAVEFAASPWAYNGKIFAASEDGDTYVLEAGPEYRLLGTNSLEERLLATPAIARGSLFIRTASSLWRIAEPGG